MWLGMWREISTNFSEIWHESRKKPYKRRHAIWTFYSPLRSLNSQKLFDWFWLRSHKLLSNIYNRKIEKVCSLNHVKKYGFVPYVDFGSNRSQTKGSTNQHNWSTNKSPGLKLKMLNGHRVCQITIILLFFYTT